MMSTRLPADAGVVRMALLDLPDAHEVDHELIGAQFFGEPGEFLSPVADDDHIRVIHDLLDRCDHETLDVRNTLHDVLTVGARELGEIDVAIVEPEVEALAEQPLDVLNQRTLAQIVRSRLEAEAEDTDLLAPRGEHHREALLDLLAV